MLNVNGKVLVKESAVGVANLLVLLYDVNNQINFESVARATNLAAAIGEIEPRSTCCMIS